MILEIENLTVEFFSSYGGIRVLDGVSLSVQAGKTLGLVGESGSGKSVTALSVMGLLNRRISRVLSGKIWFTHPEKGRIDLLSLTEKERQHIRGNHLSMIFQEPMSSLNPVKRCGWQAMEGLVVHKRLSRSGATSLMMSLFEEVKLPDPVRAFNAYPHELSGGQRQRVMIAMAMACRPSVLIADEPTTALDVTIQKEIIRLMKQLQGDHGMGILFISHDLGVVSDIADHTAVMLQGCIVETGTRETIITHPRHPYTKALIACRPSLHIRPQRLAVIDDFQSGRQPDIGITDESERRVSHERMRKAAPLLQVRGLKTQFVTATSFWGRPTSWHTAVDSIDFDLYKGETLGLVGESGCGKTSLGRSLLRLIEPSMGQVLYHGIDLSTLNARALRQLRPRIQIIFQDPYASLSPGKMVGKAILEPMQIHRILDSDSLRQERIMWLLKRVGLEERHYFRYPHEFSGGQRQRICIARALALNPEFIICDEAVSALDVSVQAQVLNLLNEMKKEFGLTYIFISHDLSVVKYMSDRVMVMHGGKLVELAEADSLYRSPKHEYTKKLLNAIPKLTFQPSSPR